ncbi:hypothetical protein N0O92_08280 [Alkalihalobacillus sp. MEB130]|uniref:hypothetical protein n=1 Tax=Alkalihalobacillus sp. MEB130 TaxID=2976704 RepID=UPI0028DE275D|nr:hypothetical protein [Alkalihalobacillus sp. MEB130]MDT8860229.1 hypothetical protein [Alkalihalobacillus sp. MEB130]
MKQNKIWILATIAIILVLVVSLYFYFHSKPSEFINESELIKVINTQYYDADVLDSVEIQEVVFLGETHVFVPFVSNDNYGTSYWVWRNRSWELGGINTIQQPYVWKVEPEDPSTYVVVWNIDPEQEMKEFDIYLLNRRGYSVSNDVHHYTPRVQLNVTVSFETKENSYGVMSLPDEWKTFLDSYVKVEQSKQPDSFMFDFIHPSNVYFAWMPYDERGELSIPVSPNGAGRGYGEIHLENLSTIPEYELE